MVNQKKIDYERIEKAIYFINQNFKDQPSLESIAKHVNVSPYHFQRMFSEWAGVSPKKFIQFLSLSHAKDLLSKKTTLLEAAYESGLSGTSRLHDLFINIEGMTPGEYKNGGANLNINYSFFDTPFGKVIVASTTKGICHLFFQQNEKQALKDLVTRFPNAKYDKYRDDFHISAYSFFKQDWNDSNKIKLHLAGTPFQLKVWEGLLQIPFGRVASYGDLAEGIGKPSSSRAVGTAIGRNPVAFLIPCHRVIKNTGHIGGYMWGSVKKSAILGWEASQSEE